MNTRVVLVVDDDPDALESMQLLLESTGYEVLVAADGREALDLLRNHAAPCLILLDLMMPRMNGWQFIAEAKHEALLGAIPVIVLSGGAFRKEEVLALDVAGYLTKPLEIETLFSILRKYC
jgi:CheY-like chemotaxis protein